VYLLEELLSPVVTPFILCFHLRSKSLDIVDFYRNFTVEVVGVGDVCSFAQMDVRHHGNPAWQTSVASPVKPQTSGPVNPIKPGMPTVANQYTQVSFMILCQVLKDCHITGR
jgi:autophagy-related protein 9